MKKIISIFTVLMITTPAMADLYNVAATSYVQGAFNALDAKLNVASAGNYISAGTDVKSNLGALDTAVAAKQNKLQNNAGTPADINASVLTTVRAASSASDTNLVTEKAVASAVETATTGMVTTSGTQTLTNKTIDADNNTISNLEADNFKTGVVRTSTDTIRATASATDTSLVTEKAVRNAIDTAATVTDSGTGVIQNVANANGGIQVTKGDAQIQVKSGGNTTIATMWIE